MVAAGVALVTCAVVDVAALATTAVAASARDVSMTWDMGACAALMVRSAGAMVLLALIGVAIGAAWPNRSAALVGVVVLLTLGEPIIGSITRAPELLPGAAVRGLVTDGTGVDALAALPAAAVLVGYLAVATSAALLQLRRDVSA